MTQTDVCDANSLYWCESSVMHRDSLPTSSSNNLKISKSKLSVLPMKKVSAANPPPHWSDSKQWNLKGWSQRSVLSQRSTSNHWQKRWLPSNNTQWWTCNIHTHLFSEDLLCEDGLHLAQWAGLDGNLQELHKNYEKHPEWQARCEWKQPVGSSAAIL